MVKVSGSARTWLLVVMSIVLIATLIALAQIDTRAILSEIRQLSAISLFAAAAVLIIGVLLATVRLWYISSDIGTPLTFKEALLALSVGQIVGAVSVQFFGQIAARSALLRSRGVSAPANIVMASYERFVAVGVSGLMAILGAWYLFGRLAVDIEGGGGQLLRLVVGIFGAVIIGAATAWGGPAFRTLAQATNAKTAAAIGRNLVLTIAVQLTTAAAYLIIARAMVETVHLSPLMAATVIIMFAASLPISFAGWGVRELSAVLALAAVGIKAATAVAISVTVGALALGAVIVIAGVAAIIAAPTNDDTARLATETEDSNIAGILKWTLPLAAATAVFFQIYIPTGTTNLNANLADPIVILGAAVFVLGYIIREQARWRFQWLNTSVVVATAMIALCFLHGYYIIGWTDWAFTNRLVGWFVLLCYGMTGALITLHAGKPGAEMFARTFVGSAMAIVLFEITLIALASAGVVFPAGVLIMPIEGFSQNRNAFSFALLLAICALPLLPRHVRTMALAIAALGLWFAGSRAAIGTVVLIVALIWYLKVLSIRQICFAALAFAATLLAVSAIPIVVGAAPSSYLGSGIPIFFENSILGSSNLQRLKSMAGGLSLFYSHPVFGGGLGVYIYEQTKAGAALVIHSTPIWLLAEGGVVGLSVFAIPAAFIFMNAWRARRNDVSAQTVILTLVTFAVMSSVHELLYQRMLWIVLGVTLACVAEASEKGPAGSPNMPVT
ncbi:MAG: lysylphosphatidylglycerol synthase transmembrane domain-containing protein [Pseudolabrys sp.]|nr:lysylphosphatidylglycerol synthase transmembrane domain-containing protein [Pseudolabrys sp.]